MPAKRRRRLWSFREELLQKSREAALAAVQIFNNPNVTFKAEIYVVLMHIAWTYLLHAYFRGKRIEYRYFTQGQPGSRRSFDRTANGAFKYWGLDRCLNDDACPLDRDTKNNLCFLIGLRNEIEHQMTTRIDDFMSARFQACCLNYSHWIGQLFGARQRIDRHLAFSLQFTSLSEEQVTMLEQQPDLPSHIRRFIDGFDGHLASEEFGSQRFAYRVLFVAKTANHKGQADRVIEFVKAGSSLEDKVNAQYVAIKETERPKFLPGFIVKKMQTAGFSRFTMHDHTCLWQKLEARSPGKGLGVDVAGTWYWYEGWLVIVENHCRENQESYA